MMSHELTHMNVTPTYTYEFVVNAFIYYAYTMCAHWQSRSATMMPHELTRMNVTPTHTYERDTNSDL